MRCSVKNIPRAGVKGLHGAANLDGRQTTGSICSDMTDPAHSTTNTTGTAIGAASLKVMVKPAHGKCTRRHFSHQILHNNNHKSCFEISELSVAAAAGGRVST